MILSELRIMRGPNMWSPDRHKLIVVKVDLNGLLETDISVTAAYIKKYLKVKSVSKHLNFYLEFAELLSKLIVNVQPVSASFYSKATFFGSSYYLISEYEIEEVGKEATYFVIDCIESRLKGRESLSFNSIAEKLKLVRKEHLHGPSTSAIITAAEEKNIPVKKNHGGSYLLGYGKYQKKIAASIVGSTGYIGVDVASNKDLTKRLLSAAYIPVPNGSLIKDESSLNKAVEEIGFPLVVKPFNANQGKGVTGNINDEASLHKAFYLAKNFSDQVIVERFIKGTDFRFLVVNDKLIAVSKRIPACVTGNGQSTIQQLIDEVNSDPNRGDGYEEALYKIKVDSSTERLLEIKGLTLQTVVKKGERVYLKDTANLSTGGTSEDVTDEVHPENSLLAERIAGIIGLDVCGIDIIAPDVNTPISSNGGAVLEVNAEPGLRMHIFPSKGRSRDVGGKIVDLMFPDRNKIRIPIVAITGTNGKTTTSRLMAFIADKEKYSVGLTTTDGVYIKGALISAGDCTGPKSANVILNDPIVDFAVFECARGGIIRSGLAFDECDIAIVTNIAEDHIGLKDINTLDDLSRVKVVVPRSVKANGYAILNAMDDLVYKMKDQVICNVAFFSLDPENERLIEHCEKGGFGITMNKNKNIIILKGKTEKIAVDNVMNIPLTMDGKADFMIENILPVVLASYISGFEMTNIREGLQQFIPSADRTPGRLNKFEINGVNVIVDYAHNPHGLKAIGRFLSHIGDFKTGIVTGVGDRRNNDIIEIGEIAAQIYDKVIVRVDSDTRGRTPEEISELVIEGIQKADPKKQFHLIPNTKDALKFAIENSEKNSYVIISADDVPETISIMKELEEEFA